MFIDMMIRGFKSAMPVTVTQVTRTLSVKMETWRIDSSSSSDSSSDDEPLANLVPAPTNKQKILSMDEEAVHLS